MIPLDEYTRLKRAADEQRALAERKRGELARVEAELKREFGVSTAREAEALARRLEKQLEREEAEFQAALEKFQEDHPGVLE